MWNALPSHSHRYLREIKTWFKDSIWQSQQSTYTSKWHSGQAVGKLYLNLVVRRIPFFGPGWSHQPSFPNGPSFSDLRTMAFLGHICWNASIIRVSKFGVHLIKHHHALPVVWHQLRNNHLSSLLTLYRAFSSVESHGRITRSISFLHNRKWCNSNAIPTRETFKRYKQNVASFTAKMSKNLGHYWDTPMAEATPGQATYSSLPDTTDSITIPVKKLSKSVTEKLHEPGYWLVRGFIIWSTGICAVGRL